MGDGDEVGDDEGSASEEPSDPPADPPASEPSEADGADESASPTDDTDAAPEDDAGESDVSEPAPEPDTDEDSTESESETDSHADATESDPDDAAPESVSANGGEAVEADGEAAESGDEGSADGTLEPVEREPEEPSVEEDAEEEGEGVKPLIEDERDVHYDPDPVTGTDHSETDPADLHAPPEGAEDAVGYDPSRPPDDQEMPLTEHVDEMIKRLSVVVGVILVVTLVVFPFAEEPILFIWDNVLPPSELTAPRVYGPLELKLAELKFAMLAGFVLALPVFVYETYLFMRPGLYPRERRYYLAAIPTSLVLAFIGLAFGFFLILPALFSYFLTYSKNAGEIAFALKQTFDLVLLIEGYLALVFQIPLFIMLAIMMGLTTRDWLASRRIYFWGGFLGISYIFGLDPTGVAPVLVAATMVMLFEGTLLLLKWTQRGD